MAADLATKLNVERLQSQAWSRLLKVKPRRASPDHRLGVPCLVASSFRSSKERPMMMSNETPRSRLGEISGELEERRDTRIIDFYQCI